MNRKITRQNGNKRTEISSSELADEEWLPFTDATLIKIVMIHVCMANNMCTMHQVQMNGKFEQFPRNWSTMPVADLMLLVTMQIVLFSISTTI